MARLVLPCTTSFDHQPYVHSSASIISVPFLSQTSRLRSRTGFISLCSSQLSTDVDDSYQQPETSQKPPPWQKTENSSRESSGAAKLHNFRPAPWQQGFRDLAPDTKLQDDTESASQAEADKSAMAVIVEKLRTIQSEPDKYLRSSPPQGSQQSSTRDKTSELVEESKFPWEKDEENDEKLNFVEDKRPVSKYPTRAELLVPPSELKRIRSQCAALEERLKIGKLGVTRSIVLSIQDTWTTSELVKVRCEGPAANSIKKTMKDLEKMTGGLVVWRAGNLVVIHKGTGYVETSNAGDNEGEKAHTSQVMQTIHSSKDVVQITGPKEISVIPEPTDNLEAESLLEGLGPRYEKWTGLRPIPVDADLLPAEIPNYRPPFRLLPFGARPVLTETELTDIRRLARPLAPHFVLGRNRGHHGLAAAIVKLWEKSEIVKIAVKKRVQNTNNEIMADEIRRLTGGVLLSRDKYFITFYRGKDFVPQKVAETLQKREVTVRDLQEEEERSRQERNIPVVRPSSIQPSVAVIGMEAPTVTPSWVHTMDTEEQIRLKKEAAKLRKITLARQMEKKLQIAMRKKDKAEQNRQKVESFLTPIERPADTEIITEEERFMFRRLGLRMKAALLIGRRGVFDGVVENMHLHWKHRELVKVLVKEQSPAQVQETARMLEYESGGVLVAVVPTSKGQAIIMYRGKNYQRPTELRPRNLLNKQKALKRSLEMQRHMSLTNHIEDLEREIFKIKDDLERIGQEVDDRDMSDYDYSSMEDEEDDPLYFEQQEKNKIKAEVRNENELKDDIDTKFFEKKIKKLESLVRLGPIYKADPLTNIERLKLRKQALSSNKASQFHVGKSNELEGLARAIRMYLLHHAFVKVVVKGRGQGKSVQDIVNDLEKLTGAVLVSQENNKIILYRGWPEGDDILTTETLDNISPELRDALMSEELWVDDEDQITISEYDSGNEGIEISDDESEDNEDQTIVAQNDDSEEWSDEEDEDYDEEDEEDEEDEADEDTIFASQLQFKNEEDYTIASEGKAHVSIGGSDAW